MACAKKMSKAAQKMIAPVLNQLLLNKLMVRNGWLDVSVEFAQREIVANMLNLDVSMLSLALGDVGLAQDEGVDELALLAERYAYWMK